MLYRVQHIKRKTPSRSLDSETSGRYSILVVRTGVMNRTRNRRAIGMFMHFTCV